MAASTPRRIFGALLRVFAASLSLVIIIFNARLYCSADSQSLPPATSEQLAHLGLALRGGAAETAQHSFPEGYFFANAMVGLAHVEVGRYAKQGSAARRQALAQARWALKQIETPAGRAPFSQIGTLRYGVFYHGWHNWLLGGVLSLQPRHQRNEQELAGFRRASALLAAAFRASSTPFLSAYENASWPVDSSVAMASLSLHDHLLEPRYGQVIGRWRAMAKERLDPKTKLLPHKTDSLTGRAVSAPRASSQTMMLRFLAEIDRGWSNQLYRRYRRAFIDQRLGLCGVLEYPKGKTGQGDVDSGPLILDLSPSATVVGLAAARVHGDDELIARLAGSIEAVGFPFGVSNKRYGLGLIPVADAFLAWSRSTRPWTFSAGPGEFSPLEIGWRRWPMHGIAIAILLLIWLPFFARRLTSRRKAPEPKRVS